MVAALDGRQQPDGTREAPAEDARKAHAVRDHQPLWQTPLAGRHAKRGTLQRVRGPHPPVGNLICVAPALLDAEVLHAITRYVRQLL